MTVFENVLVGATYGGGRAEREAYAGCLDALEQTGLAARANTLAGALTLLDRKRLELARALATRPRVLLLDEIAGGLTEPEVQALVGVDPRRSAASGVAIVWIEHIVHALRAVVDRLVAIDFGRSAGGRARPRRSWPSPEVQRVYLGHRGRERCCASRDLSAFYGDFQALFGISLEVDEGEMVAVIGANGAGKIDLPARAGRRCCRVPAAPSCFDGRPIGGLPAHRARRSRHRAGARGAAHLPQPVASGEPAGRRLSRGARGRGRSSACTRLFPVLGERRGQPRHQPLGRRAADARHRPRR